MPRYYNVRIIKVPEHIIGGPFMVQVVYQDTLKVAALRTGIATRERAETVAYDYRRTYPAAPEVPYVETDIETAYGSMVRLSRSVRVF
jgi:hypothetical protein